MSATGFSLVSCLIVVKITAVFFTIMLRHVDIHIWYLLKTSDEVMI